jgi:hypothetical protein
MPGRWKTTAVRIGYLALAAAALASGGCVAAAIGVAAGGAAAGGYYVYSRGKVTQDYVANIDDVWAASHVALQELGMPLLKEDRTGGAGTASLESRTADGERVFISMELEDSRIPAEGAVTRVGVRVGTVSLGDQVVSERVLAQIGAHLTPTTRAAAAPPQTPPPPLLPPEPAPAQWNKPAGGGTGR